MRVAVLSLWTLAPFGAALFFACAASDDQPVDPGSPDAQVIPDLESDGGSSDACDASEPCIPVDCSTVDFCPAPMPDSVSTLVSLNAVWGSGPQDIWVVGSRSTILHGDGSTFRVITTGTDANYVAVWGTSPTDVWLLGPSFPLHSTGYQNDTATFEPREGSSFKPDQVSGGRLWAGQSAGGQVWIAGESSGRFGGLPGSFWYLGTDEMGQPVWNMVRSCDGFLPCTPGIRGLWTADGKMLWAVGTTGAAFFFDRSAATAGGPEIRWQPQDSHTREDLGGIWGSSPNDIWAVGAYGTIRHTSKDAATWTAVPSPTTKDLHAVWGSGPSDVWAVGAEGTIIHYDGTKWSLAASGLPTGVTSPILYGVWGSGPDDVWAVGEGVILHHSPVNRGSR